MNRIHDRRRPEFQRVRIYMDAIKDAKAMTDAQWVDNWVTHAHADDRYIPRSVFIDYLEACALREVDNLLRDAA